MVKNASVEFETATHTRSVYTTNKLLHQIKPSFVLPRLCLEAGQTEAWFLELLQNMQLSRKCAFQR